MHDPHDPREAPPDGDRTRPVYKGALADSNTPKGVLQRKVLDHIKYKGPAGATREEAGRALGRPASDLCSSFLALYKAGLIGPEGVRLTLAGRNAEVFLWWQYVQRWKDYPTQEQRASAASMERLARGG